VQKEVIESGRKLVKSFLVGLGWRNDFLKGVYGDQ
jgi:hypothetical protein